MAEAPKRVPFVKVSCAGVEGGGAGYFVSYPDVEDVKLVEVLEDGTERPMHMHSVSSLTWTAKCGEPTALQVEYLGAAIEVDVPRAKAPLLPKPGQIVPFVDERYQNDDGFRALVNQFVRYYAEGCFSPSDVRSAATYASILFEMRRETRFKYNPETGELRREDSK